MLRRVPCRGRHRLPPWARPQATRDWISSRQQAMDQDKARDFFGQIVVDNGTDLSALLDASPIDEGLQEGLQRISHVVQTLRDAADINPLLTVEVDQVLAGDSTVLRIAISCNHDPGGIEAVQ